MIIIIATIIIEVLIGSIFLLYNTASLMLALFFPDTLSKPEKELNAYRRNSVGNLYQMLERNLL